MCQAQFGDCRSRRAAASGHTSLLHWMVTAVASCLFSLAHTLAPLCSSLALSRAHTHKHTRTQSPAHSGSGWNQLGEQTRSPLAVFYLFSSFLLFNQMRVLRGVRLKIATTTTTTRRREKSTQRQSEQRANRQKSIGVINCGSQPLNNTPTRSYISRRPARSVKNHSFSMQHPFPTLQWLSCAGKCSPSDSEADVLAASLGVGYGGRGGGGGGGLLLLLFFPPFKSGGCRQGCSEKS